MINPYTHVRNEKNEFWLNVLGVITWVLVIIFLYGLFLTFAVPWPANDTKIFVIFVIGGISTLMGLVLLGLENRGLFSRLWSSPILKIILGLATYVVATISVVYSNKFIADVAGINPSRLESGQHLLSIFIAPLVWSVAFSAIILIAYFAHAFSLLPSSAVKSRDIWQKIRRSAVFASLLIGLSITGSGIPLAYTTPQAERLLKEVFVFSSYLDNKLSDNKLLCTNVAPTVSVTFLENDSISVAERDKDGVWQFHVSTCQPHLKTPSPMHFSN